MGALSVWADISLMWLIFLAFISILPIAVLFFYMIKGLHRLRQLAILYLPLVQDKARLVASKSDEISHQVARPFIAVHTKSAQANGLRKAIFTRRQEP
jgi:hypothetical protein